MKEPQEILEYWFGADRSNIDVTLRNEMWWKKDPKVDAEIKAKFSSTLEASAQGELDDWKYSADGRLAHIILVDQMSRNMHRDTPLMFAQDDLGQELALRCAISDEYYTNYFERMFQYMPLMHAETRSLQRLCVHMFEREVELAQSDEVREAAKGNLDFAEKHMVIVERFGRFPHRNTVLGRDSTAEEIEFLKEPGSSF